VFATNVRELVPFATPSIRGGSNTRNALMVAPDLAANLLAAAKAQDFTIASPAVAAEQIKHSAIETDPAIPIWRLEQAIPSDSSPSKLDRGSGATPNKYQRPSKGMNF
jgi:hypothetical protein